MEKYEKVLDLLRQKGRLRVDDADLVALLSRDADQKSNLVYRVTAYMSYIRRFAKLEVKALREGRKVWAYELVPVGVDADGKTLYQHSKYVMKSGPEEQHA